MRTYLVTVRDHGHEVCLEIEAADTKDARGQAYALHPMGVVVRVEKQGA